MTKFKYKLLTSSSGTVEGEKEAISKAELINELRKSGQIILNIQQVTKDKKLDYLQTAQTRKPFYLLPRNWQRCLKAAFLLTKACPYYYPGMTIKSKALLKIC